VIIAVPNPDEKLRPKMTANVTIDVAAVHDVLRVPNAALRFKPEPGTVPQTGTAGPRGQRTGTATGTAPGGAAAGGGPSPEQRMAQYAHRQRGIGGAAMPFGNRGPRKPPQIVYVLGANNQLTPVYIRTGITDGHYTAVVGGKLEAGQNVVIGLATSKVEGPPPPGSGRGPMGRGR
jgi:HlyD family secretion protein